MSTAASRTKLMRYFALACAPLWCVGSTQEIILYPPGALAEASIQTHQTSIENIENKAIVKGFSGDQIWKSSHKDHKVLVRLHAANKSQTDRLRELQATQRASQLGIGPTYLLSDAQQKFIVTSFLDGKHPNRTQMAQSPYLEKLIDQIKTLHQSSPLDHTWSIFHYIRSKAPIHPNKTESHSLSELKKIQKKLKKSRIKFVPSHNDIHPGNIIIQHETPYLIDWGDAGMHDPFWDLARISMEFALSAAQDEAMLERYFDTPANKRQLNRLYIMKQVYILRCAFWLKNFTGRPNTEQLNEIQKIFEVNGLPFTQKNEVHWHDIAQHALKVFTKNRQSKPYQKALRHL